MNERVNPSVARPVISQRAGVTARRVGVNLGAEITGVDLRANALGRRSLRRSRRRWSRTS